MMFEGSSHSEGERLERESNGDFGAIVKDSDGDIWESDRDEHRSGVIEDDDFYGQRPTEPETAEIAALRRTHAKQGYLDGLASKKEETLQEGFDIGYPSGALIGKQVGKILGTLLCLVALGQEEAKELIDLAKQELHIRKVLGNRYFDENLELKREHPVIQEWEDRVSKLLQGMKS